MMKIETLVAKKYREIFVKKYSAVSIYFEKFFNDEDFVFDFESQDLIETRSNLKDYGETHCPHVLSHIAPRKDWAIRKINAAFQEKKGMKTDTEGTFHPTWFADESDASDYLMAILTNITNAEKIERYCNDRDIYYNDKRNNRLVIKMNFDDVVGYGMSAGTDYNSTFECHGLQIVLEYTISRKDGEFVVYDMYPVFTEEDWKVVSVAKADWKAKKNK